MKIEFVEREWGIEFNLTPETVAETAQLFRFANNTKAEKPDVFLSFSSDTPWASITLKKIKVVGQKNTVRR